MNIGLQYMKYIEEYIPKLHIHQHGQPTRPYATNLISNQLAIRLVGSSTSSSNSMHSHGLQGIMIFPQCIINMYYTHIQDVLQYNDQLLSPFTCVILVSFVVLLHILSNILIVNIDLAPRSHCEEILTWYQIFMELQIKTKSV